MSNEIPSFNLATASNDFDCFSHRICLNYHPTTYQRAEERRERRGGTLSELAIFNPGFEEEVESDFGFDLLDLLGAIASAWFVES